MTRRFMLFPAGSGNGLKVWSRLLSWCLVLLFACAAGLAQQSTAELLGTVTDSSGAVVPDVKITLTHSGTQDTRDTITNQLGDYRFPFVAIGTYSVKAEGQGFQAVTVNQLVLSVDDARRQDFTFKVGAVTESVTITATAGP